MLEPCIDTPVAPRAGNRPVIVPREAPDNDISWQRKRFDLYFEVISADTPELLRKAYELRYQVYCLERGFEDGTEHPDGLEIDEFDSHARHSLLVHRPTGQAIGAVRLVLPVPGAHHNSFPIQNLTDHALVRCPSAFPVASMAEISRFSISKEFRRRRTDTLYGEGNAPRAGEDEPGDRRSGALVRLGLMLAICRMSAELGVTDWCAVMEPALLRILAMTGVHFEMIGPPVEYHGLRQPCHGNICALMARLAREQPAAWDLVTDGGTLWDVFYRAQRERDRVPA